MAKLENIKHEQFAKALVKKKFNRKRAYMEVYPDSKANSAEVSASRLLKNKPNIKDRVREIAEQKGLTLDYLVTNLADLTQAQKTIFDKLGTPLEIPENNIRLSATETGLKLYGVLTNDRQAQISLTDARSVNISPDESNVNCIKSISSMLSKLNESLANKEA